MSMEPPPKSELSVYRYRTKEMEEWDGNRAKKGKKGGEIDHGKERET